MVLLFGKILDSQPTSALAEPQTSHPRLWVRADDVPRLQAWAVESNPIFQNGLAILAADAKAAMDAGSVPNEDTGGRSYESYPTEMYAQLFAFMSLISSDPAERDDYAGRARTLLMHIMNEAVKGSAEGEPFRDPFFSTADRSRWYGSAYGLTVDWIYPYLSAEDKVIIREVFLRWIDENINAITTTSNHPEPIGVLNDPVLTSDPILVRWAGNNYYSAHMRNIGLMAMSFDPADDPDGELTSYVENAIGAWLYITDHLMRTDTLGGFGTEGFEYSPQSLGYVAQLLLALHTAGYDEVERWGRQVSFAENPFWNDAVVAYLHSLSPTTATHEYLGEVYQPAWYGSAQNYFAPDFIEAFGPLGIYDGLTGNAARLDTLRWIELNAAPGIRERLDDRLRDTNSFVNSIFYFMLLDPAAVEPSDPRPALSLFHYGPGMRRLLARTDWGTEASWFTYALTWNSVDHQTGNGNTIEFYRDGEWLTKQRVGYDLDYATSDGLNTLTVQNDRPDHPDDDYRIMLWERGSQWLYNPAGDPPQPLFSVTDDFVYAQGDATNLYNSEYEGIMDVQHVSRSVIWLKPDFIVVYDRAATGQPDRIKRFQLNLPAEGVIDGDLTTMTTEWGQQLFVTSLLPEDVTITMISGPEEISAPPANGEPMKFRLQVEATGNPQEVRFLNVLQGADAGVAVTPPSIVRSTSGTAFEGAIVGEVAVLFAVNLDESLTEVVYTVPFSAPLHIVTGLQPNTGYDLSIFNDPVAQTAQVTLTLGDGIQSDAAGVIIFGIP